MLKALLPETGTDIKGQMRSRQELLDASGYTNRSREFDDLLSILDPELRLITPTEAGGVEGEGWSVESDTSRKEGVRPTTLHSPRTTRHAPLPE